MKKYVLTVTLNPALDHFIVKGNKEFVFAGGKGINVARALLGFKVPVLATGFVGGICGELIKGFLDQEGIPHHFVSIQGQSRINKTYVQKNIARKIEQGPRITREEQKIFRKHFIQLLKNASYVVLSGRLAVGLSDSFYKDLIQVAHQKGIRTVLDTSGCALKKAIIARPWLIKPNQKEAEDVLAMDLKSVHQILKAMKKFHAQGITHVLLSAGVQGAFGSHQPIVYHVKAPRIKIFHDVGCGDSFLAGFLFSYLKKQSFPEALEFAVACGTANAFELIPGLIRRKILLKLLKQTKAQVFATL